MKTKISVYPTKLFNIIIITILLFILGITAINAQGFKTITSLASVTATANTGEKPQSKVWFYQGYWFTVIPVTGGTYVYRLDGTTWTQLIQISLQTTVKADVKLYGNKTYVLLKTTGTLQFQSAELITIDFQAGSPPSYTKTAPVTNISIDNFAEMATIDIDSNGRMWLASDGGQPTILTNPKNIYVRWSDPPYSIWNTPITLATGINYDDICSITAFGGNKIGVLWSDQTLKKFGFAYHNDGDPVNTWTFETAAIDALSGGISDDHINLAVASNGTLYAAVKTSYTGHSLPTIGLLVRRPVGTWDPIYPVTIIDDAAPGTRPIVLLNESENILTVVYTEKDGWHDILYKESPTNPISFPVTPNQFLRNSSAGFNDVSSTKQNYTDSVVVLFSTQLNIWESVIAKRTGPYTTNGAGYSLAFDGTNDQLRVEPNSSINFLSSFTVEAWINPAINKSQSIFNKTSSSTNGYNLALNSSGNVIFRINDITLQSSTLISSNVWTHVAATYSPSSNGVKIYINGILDPITATATLSGNTTRLYIGSLASSSWFNGSLDEIRFWNTERTIDDIRVNMCKKLTGSESNLVGYWNFDTEEGLNIPDLSANLTHDNFATMQDMNNYLYSWSGAAIGNASAYDYDLVGGYTQTLSHPDGDMITAEAASGFVVGLQVYRVDAPPLRPGAINLSNTYPIIDPLRYWGVKIIGTSGPTYNVTYNYNGHPGIVDENFLNAAFRDNLSDNTWEDLSATLNTSANTLTKTGLTGTQFALLSSSNPLPVELSLFNAVKSKSGVKLSWRTETEVNNYGFEIERASSSTTPLQGWEKIGFVNGNGNSNSPKDYFFMDELNASYGTIYYRLKQIDNDGKFEYSDEISVNLGVPSVFSLSQNYPNPFNPSTKISYTVPVDSKVSLKVYDILGNLVETLVDEQKEAGYYEVNFNGSALSSGIYFYTISADNFNQTKKMTLLK